MHHVLVGPIFDDIRLAAPPVWSGIAHAELGEQRSRSQSSLRVR